MSSASLFSIPTSKRRLPQLSAWIMSHFAWVVLILAIGTTALVFSIVRRSEQHAALVTVDLLARQTSAKVQLRLDASAQLLRSTAALLLLNRIVQRHTWNAYQQQLKQQGLPAGLRQIGYAQPISSKDKVALVSTLRADGMRDYRIHPLRAQGPHVPVLYLAPESGNRIIAPGFDLLADPAAASALARATDSGRITLSAALEPSSFRIESMPGSFLMVLPIFPGGVIPTSVAQRRQLLIGFVFATLQLDPTVLDGMQSAASVLRVIDDSPGIAATVLYQSTPDQPVLNSKPVPLMVFDRHWTIDVDALPAANAASQKANTVATCGILLSLLLCWLTQSAVRIRLEAARRASDSARDLGRVQTELAALIGLNQQAIITIDRKQRIMAFNASAERIFQTTADLTIGTTLSRLLPYRLKGAQPVKIAALRSARVAVYQLSHQPKRLARRSNGETFPFEATIFKATGWAQPCYTILLSELPVNTTTTEPPRDSNDARLPNRRRWQPVSADRRQIVQQLQSRISTYDFFREEQQKRIAQEMHDDFGQLLTAMKMDLGTLQAQLTSIDVRLIRPLRSIGDMVDAMVTSVRRIMADLPPKLVDEHGLFKALRMLADSHAKRHRIDCQLSLPAGYPVLDDRMATPLYRMVQEALNNIAKHADATSVVISLEMAMQDGHLTLAIADNGKGIAREEWQKAGSFGLIGMQERVGALNGEMYIDSSASTGTTIRIRIPIDEVMAVVEPPADTLVQ